MANELQLVGFRIGKETFGVPIERVHEIVRVPEVTAVPDCLDYVEGVINLRGRIVSVVDLRKRFGADDTKRQATNRILVTDLEGTMVGLMVDAASEVLKLPQGEIEAPPAHVFDDESNYVTGVGKLNGRLIILLDLKKILGKGELRRLRDISHAQSQPNA
jgi:purine-binding chemotaxis protein CheW